MPTVNVPNIGRVNFPDTMSQEEIVSAIQAMPSVGKGLSPAASSPAASQAAKDPSLWERYKSGWSGFGEGVMGAAEGLAALPGQAIRAPGQWADIYQQAKAQPGQTAREVGEAGLEFAKGMIPYRETAGEILGGNIPSARTFGRETGGLTAGALVGAVAPAAARNLPSSVVKKTASSGSRMETATGMMERTPTRLPVTQDIVDTAFNEARTLANVPSPTKAPLSNTAAKVAEMNAQANLSPLASLRETPLAKQLNTLEREVGHYPQGVNAAEMDSIIKGVNLKIKGADGAERGAWKQVLGGIHEDIKAAARSTNDPAFQAFDDAIYKARLNFLKDDLIDAIRRGTPFNRPGESQIAKPGPVKDWMRAHPEWTENLEKASPGALAQIQADIEAIVPIANTTAKSIPGANFGSGRGVIGASLGHVMNTILHLPPGMSEALGAIGGFLSRIGVPYPVSTVERAFTRTPSPLSTVGGATGAILSKMPRND